MTHSEPVPIPPVSLAGGAPAREPFSSERWKDPAQNEGLETARLKMIDDLLNTHPLKGLHRDDVVRLLGEPDKTDKFSTWDMVYVLGPGGGYYSMDYEWLLIRLGPDGRVKKHRVTSD